MYMVPSAEPQAIFEAPQLKDARAKSQLILKCSWLQGIENGFYESQLHAEPPGGGALISTYAKVDITWFFRKSNSFIVSSLTEHIR